MIKLRVPATSANMGAGFDTLGVAVGLYNRMMIEEIPEGLEVINKNTQSFIPQDTSNLIYRAMAELFDYVGYEQKGYRITQDSQIPMTRGLGSSSACIIGEIGVGAASRRHRQRMERGLQSLAANTLPSKD